MSSSCDHLPAILVELQSVLPASLLDPSLKGCRIAMGDEVDTETFVHSVTDTEGKVVLAGTLFDTAEKWVDEALDHMVMATVCPEDTTGVIETMCITFTVDNDLRAKDIAAAITKPEALQSLLDYYNGTYASDDEE